MGYLPGSQLVPCAISTDVSGPLTFDDFAQYQEVITGSAINGATVIWKPMTPQNHFRPCKPIVYDAYGDTFQSLITTDDVSTHTATWDLDPEVYPAVQGLGLASRDESGTLDTLEVANRLQASNLPLNSPCLVIMAEGLPADTEVYAGEIVVHYEGIADNRGFSLVQPQTRSARTDTVHKAIARVNRVHPAHTGGTIGAHRSWVDQAIRVTGTIANTASAVSSIVSNAPKVVAPLIEAAEVLAALI